MIRVLLLRLAQLVPMMLVASGLAFAMSAALGDPITPLIGLDAPAEVVAKTRASLGIDRPLPARYWRFLGAALHGDLGVSWRAGGPVSAVLAERFPASAELAGCAAFIAVGLGVPLGLLAALRPGSGLGMAAGLGMTLAAATPPFLLGLLLIQWLAVDAGLLPAFGRGEVVGIAGWPSGLLSADGRRALVLPAVTLGLFQAALLFRLTRAEMAAILDGLPIRFARARGLPNRAVALLAMRLVCAPLVIVALPQLGGLLAFGIVTESVFRWPGLGALLIQSIQSADTPVVAGCLMLAAVAFGLLSLAADLLGMALDPRLRRSAGSFS